LEDRISPGPDEEEQAKIMIDRMSASRQSPNAARKDQIKSALEQGKRDFAKAANAFSEIKRGQTHTSHSEIQSGKIAKRPSTKQYTNSSQKERVLKGTKEGEITLTANRNAIRENQFEDELNELPDSNERDIMNVGGKAYQSDVDLKVPEEAFFKKNNRQSKESLQEPQRNRSKSFDRTSYQSVPRPRSGSRGSRNFAADVSQYSSVHSRILNAGEVNKIRKLVGEKNSDLDVSSD
jgi:hypothetical protein